MSTSLVDKRFTRQSATLFYPIGLEISRILSAAGCTVLVGARNR